MKSYTCPCRTFHCIQFCRPVLLTVSLHSVLCMAVRLFSLLSVLQPQLFTTGPCYDCFTALNSTCLSCSRFHCIQFYRPLLLTVSLRSVLPSPCYLLTGPCYDCLHSILQAPVVDFHCVQFFPAPVIYSQAPVMIV